MDGEWLIQYTESYANEDAAHTALIALRKQVDYHGGRVCPPGPGKPWRVQAFFDDVPPTAVGPNWLPDGLRRVYVPRSVRANLGLPT